MVRKILGPTGEEVEMTPLKEYEVDSAGLCGSRHIMSIGDDLQS